MHIQVSAKREKGHGKGSYRNRLIATYISNPFWYTVLELLLNMIDKDQPDTEILDDLLLRQLINKDSFLFLLEILPRLKNISKEAQVAVYTRVIGYLVTEYDPKRSGNRALMELAEKMEHHLIYYKTQRELLHTAFLSFNEKERTVGFYRLISELNPPFFVKNRIDFSALRETAGYKAAVEQLPFLFVLDKRREKRDYFGDLIRFIDLFGIEELFKRQSSYYYRFFLAPFINYYWINQLREEHFDSIEAHLDLLYQKGVSKERLLRETLKGAIKLYFPDKEQVRFLFLHLEEMEDILKVIFLVSLKVTCTLMISRWKIEDLKIPADLQDLWRQLLTAKSRKEELHVLVNRLPITDKEVLDAYAKVTKERKRG